MYASLLTWLACFNRKIAQQSVSTGHNADINLHGRETRKKERQISLESNVLAGEN